MITLILYLIIWLAAITVAITIHESAHALMADKLGDPNPRLHGRISLNPLDHYDRVGTTMLLVTSILRATGAPVLPFGWAKPVEFDPYNLKDPRRDAALIALAGPVSNIVLSVILSTILKTFLFELPLISIIVTAMITVNVSLAIFNLVPIDPLDGGKILVGLLPSELAHEYQVIMHNYGIIILMLMILPFGGISPLSALISPVINWLIGLIL